jgi:hypothetical protein
MLYHARTSLATSLADALQGKTPFSDAPNGLFLAAPRRTGKSTFLQADLMPELARRQVVGVYVDLWADQNRDPGALIAEAVGRALLKQLGMVAKTVLAAGLESINVGGIKIDTAKIGKVDGTTLADALRALVEATNNPVALIIDEAQHALTSVAGETAMAALKSARDQLNRPGQVQLIAVNAMRLQSGEYILHRRAALLVNINPSVQSIAIGTEQCRCRQWLTIAVERVADGSNITRTLFKVCRWSDDQCPATLITGIDVQLCPNQLTLTRISLYQQHRRILPQGVGHIADGGRASALQIYSW